MSFEQSLAMGKAGESAISMWLRRRGWCVLPVYEKVLDEAKGPQLYLPEGALIAPDLLVFKGGDALWVEAKSKSAFTWHRKTRRWVTGIDVRHYEDYCRLEDRTPWPLWLLFLHGRGRAKDSPEGSPVGLFGNTLERLRETENHRHGAWGSCGMVYWAVDALRVVASLDEVLSCAGVNNGVATEAR